MLVSQLGVKAKNFTVKIMTIYYHIKSMEGKFMKPNRRNSLDVRWHSPLERSVTCTCTCCKEKFSSPFEWPIFRRRNIVTIIRNLKKKKCICKIIGAVYKLNNTVSKTHFHLDYPVCQTCTGEFWFNYGLFGDNNLCSVSDLNHSQIVTDNKIRKTS